MGQIKKKKEVFSEKKENQEKALTALKEDVLSFQLATDHELRQRQEKAERTKLERELRELENIKIMNKRERERFHDIHKQLRKKRQEEEQVKRVVIENKLQRAQENYEKKVI